MQHTTGPIDGEDRGILGAMWRYRLLVLGVVVVAVGLGAGIAMLQPDVYTASAHVYMADPRAEGVFGSAPAGDDGRRQQNRVERFRSEPVLTRAAAAVGSSLQLGELREVVEVVPAAVADEITVTVQSPDPVMASDLANAVVDAYREQYRAEALADAERTVAVLDEELVALQANLERIDAELAPLVEESDGTEEEEDALPTSQVTILTLRRDAEATLIGEVLVKRAQVMIEGRAAEDIARVEAAEVPSSPSRDPVMTISLALALGVVAGALLAVWREERRRARALEAHREAMAGVRRPVMPPPQPAGRR